jgi:hypothetical protein
MVRAVTYENAFRLGAGQSDASLGCEIRQTSYAGNTMHSTLTFGTDSDTMCCSRSGNGPNVSSVPLNLNTRIRIYDTT